MGRKSFSLVPQFFILLLSAGLALSLPYLTSLVTENFAGVWTVFQNDRMLRTALEPAAAAGLFLFFSLIRKAWKDRSLARMARSAGLVNAAPFGGVSFKRYSRIKARTMKESRGTARKLMIIGSTGRSFSEPEGDLHEAVLRSREARIILLDPREHGAIARAQSIPDPEITHEVIRAQIMKSIDFIKDVRAGDKTISLKLYPDMPLFKMAILGDAVYLRHYHTGLNVRYMPEFVFRNQEQHGGLYMPLYRYFLQRWQDPDIPEYDLDTDELVYRDQLGYEVLREPFEPVPLSAEEKEGNEEGRAHYLFR